MNIYPAIDIKNGQCVRLYQGDYQRETIYHGDPLVMAKKFMHEGAKWLHLVDLDGAKNPQNNQSALIKKIITTLDVNVQTGGGIRTQSHIKNLLEQGAKRVIIGSMAVTHSADVLSWFKYFGAERLVLALDIVINEYQCPIVTTHAWQKISTYSLYDLIDFYHPAGLQHLLCTNITLDGTLSGPDYTLYDSLLHIYPFLKLQASGGIQSLSDITMLNEKRLSGAVIGRALYEKRFTLQEVLSC